MPGNAGAGVAEPGRRLRAGRLSVALLCARARGKFGGIDTDPGYLRGGKAVHPKVASLYYYTDRLTPMPGPFGL